MSVALWVIDASRGVQRLPAVKRFGGGTFGFLSLPLGSTPAQAQAVRGAGLRVNLHGESSGRTPAELVAALAAGIQALAPGLVDADCEVADAQLAAYMRETVTLFRADFPSHQLRLTIAPNKQGFLPGDLYPGDPNLYAAMFTYYGNMQGRFSEATAQTLLEQTVPRGRAAVVYAATCDVYSAGRWQRALTLPTVFEDGTVVGTLGGGPVFSDDLLADSGLLT